jgi:outer membrane lipoprotein-sorting protein
MDTWFPIKRESSLRNYVHSVKYANLKINEPLDESLFTLNVPSDVQIINALPGAGFLPNVGAGQ